MRARQRLSFIEMLSLMNLIFIMTPVKQVIDGTTAGHEQVTIPEDEEPIEVPNEIQP